MPFYDFHCPKCRTQFEENLSIAERNRQDVTCPECGHAGARRGVTAPNLGSGSSSPAPFPT